MGYSILFRELPLDNLEQVAAAVGRVYEIPAFDAANLVRRGWGFLDRGLDEAAAQRLAGMLDAQGIGTVVVDEDNLRPVPESQILTGFEATENGLQPQLSPPEPCAPIPWPSIAIVAAAGFAEDVVRRDTGGKAGKGGTARLVGLGVFLLTGIPVGLMGRRRDRAPTPRKVTHLVTLAQIITDGGESFLLNPEHFDFSGLGALKQVNASLNYRVLVADLIRRSGARINRGARFLLERKSLTLANYQGLTDFETELAWMLNTT